LDEYGLLKEDLQKIGVDVYEKFEDFKVIYQKKEIEILSEGAEVFLEFKVLVSYNGQRTFLFGDLNRPASVILLLNKNESVDTDWEITGIKDLKSRWPMPSKNLVK